MESSNAQDRKKEIERMKERVATLRERKNAREEAAKGVAIDASGVDGVDMASLLRAVSSSNRGGTTSPTSSSRRGLSFKRPSPVSFSRLRTAAQVGGVSIAPRVVEAYEKSTQAASPPEGCDAEDDSGRPLASSPAVGVEKQERPQNASNLNVVDGVHVEEGVNGAENPSPEIDANGISRILQSSDFNDFFTNTSLLMERVLGAEKFGVFANYLGGDDIEGCRSDEDRRQALRYATTLSDDKWSRGRPVHSLGTSPKFPEVTVASYGPDDSRPRQPDGCALLWSLALEGRPEAAFTAQSAVLTCRIDTFNPQILIGGTYSGSIVLWDARAKESPVCQSPLSARGHAHPVFAMAQVGSQNAQSLVTVSTDGRLCFWSLSMLMNPQEYIDLRRGNRDAAVTSLAMQDGESNALYLGTEEGSIVQAQLHNLSSTKSSISDSHEGHSGPVTSVHFMPSSSLTCSAESQSYDFSDLLLSASFDWTILLWRPKHQNAPLHTFEASDEYVCDVQWHPHRLGMFASADGEGKLDLWDIAQDLEVPIWRETVFEGAPANRLCWSTDGRRVAVGDTATGTIAVYAADKEAVTPPSQNDAEILFERINEITKDVSTTVTAATTK